MTKPTATSPQDWPLDGLSAADLYALTERTQEAYQVAIEREAALVASVQSELMQQASRLRQHANEMRRLVGGQDEPEADTLRELMMLPDDELIAQTAYVLRVLLAATTAGIASTADVCDVAAASVELGATQAR